MKSKIFVYAGAIVFLFLLAGWLTMTTPGNPTRSETAIKTGRVTAVQVDSSTGDVTFRLDNEDDKRYYINRGLQLALPIDSIKDKLVNAEVQISYFNGGLGFLRNMSGARHICEVKYNDEVIYTEF